MEPGSCSSLYCIQVVRKGLVVKVQNINSHGRPALKSKKLEDIYDSEKEPRDATVKRESEYAPVVERIIKAIEPENDNVSFHSDEENLSEEMTLKQLKDKYKSKKRKLATPSSTMSTDPKEEENDDLKVFLSHLKSKKANFKRRCTNRNLFAASPNKPVSIKEEEVILEPEVSTQPISNLPEITEPLAEAPEPVFSMYQNPNADTVASIKFSDEINTEERLAVSFAEEQQLCSLNEISNTYLDNVEPRPFPSASEELAKVNNEENTHKELSRSAETVESEGSLPSLDKVNDEEQQPETCFTDAVDISILEGCLDNEKRLLESSSVSEERNLHFESPLQEVVEQISESQPPERLLSTRKAISPCSQERLCLAMNSVESTNDLGNYECKEKLTLEHHKAPEGSCIADASTAINSEGSPQLNRVKVFIGPKQIRRLRTEKRSSPPKKSNLEGPRLSRSLPQLSTGCTSIKRCSDSAIAFSLRQMHDIESLAGKLMNELKSMKDMVEEKMLFEAYRSAPLKNDADEVTSAIKNAMKVEETTRKWLSMMSRDCARFCKIMKLTPNGMIASKKSVNREGRKICFADEAGGTLCHVNYFENTEATSESDIVEQEDLSLQS